MLTTHFYNFSVVNIPMGQGFYRYFVVCLLNIVRALDVHGSSAQLNTRPHESRVIAHELWAGWKSLEANLNEHRLHGIAL
jgi:hypothetical protein